jgi:alpha-ketoglutarate-dependent taurine dioxygenase
MSFPHTPQVTASLRAVAPGAPPLTAPGAPHLPEVQRLLAGCLLERPGAAAFFAAVREALDSTGFAVVSLPGFCALPAAERDALAVGVSSVLGTPSPVGGTDDLVVWDVRPRPDLPRAQRRDNISVADGQACLHTDSTFAARPERWFGLWCVRPADHGGASVLVDGRGVWDALGRSAAGRAARDTLLTRSVPMWNGQRLVPVKVFTRTPGDGLIVRYRADLLEQGVRRVRMAAGDPVGVALALLGHTLTDPALATTVRLAESQAVFVDNHRVLHGREHFDDSRRHLLRVRMHHDPVRAELRSAS